MNKFSLCALSAAGVAAAGTMLLAANAGQPVHAIHHRGEMVNPPSRVTPSAQADLVFERQDLAAGRLNVASLAADGQSDGQTRILTTLLYRHSWDEIEDPDQVPFGIYSFTPAADITFQQEVRSSDMAYVSAGTIVDGMYFVCVPTSSTGANIDGSLYAAFDVKTKSLLATDEGSLSTVAYQLATDPTTGTVYGMFYNNDGSGWCWGTIDFRSMRRTALGNCDFMLAFGCDVDGQCYGVNTDCEFVSFDAATGDVHVIGKTGVNADYMLQSGTIDPQSGIFYWAAYGSEIGSVLYTIDKATGHATRVGQFPDQEELVAMAIPSEAVAAGAPARPEDITLTFDGPSLSGQVSVTAPNRTFDRHPLTGALQAVLLLDGNEFLTLDATPGQVLQANVTVPTDGYHTLGVYFVNQAGKGPQSSASRYFGVDAPGPVIEPTLTNAGGVAEITWDAPEESYHGGYLEPARFNYNVIRHRGGVDTLVAEHITDLEFAEPIETETIETLYYTIVACSGDTEGAAVSTNKAVFGEAFQAPCEWQLDDPDQFALFTVIDANHDGYTWEPGTWRYTQNKTTYAQCMWNPDDVTPADDWFISPKVRLQPGRVYYFQFAMNNTMETTTEIFETKLGQGTTVSDLQTTLSPAVSVPTNHATFDWYHHRDIVSVDREGLYNFAIHCISKPNYYRLYVDSLYVLAGPMLLAPDSVRDVIITPAPQARRAATVSFQAPVLTVDGHQLTALREVQVYRRSRQTLDWTLVHTFTQPAPGARCSFVDDSGLTDGFHLYRFVPVSDEGEGITSEATAYIGLDEPVSLRWVDFEFTPDGLQLFWQKADTLGAHGGYVNPDSVFYEVFDAVTYEYIERALTDTTLLIREPDLWAARQQMYFWGVIGRNRIGRPLVTFCERYVHGEPHAVPFSEPFTNGRLQSNWFTGDNNMFGGTWRIGSDPTGDGAISFTGPKGGYREIILGPIDLSATQHPVLKFDHYKTASTADSMVVSVSTHGAKSTSLRPVYTAVDAKQRVTHTVDLTPYRGCRRVTISFGGWSDNAACTQYLDNISVRDSYGHNLAMTDVKAASEVSYDATLHVSATVANYGDFPADAFSLRLYKDGRTLVSELQGLSLEPDLSQTYQLDYQASITDADTISLHAELAYDADELPEDDALAPFLVRVRKPLIPAVTDLRGELQGHDLLLSWSEPEGLDGLPVRQVTDDFEDYMDFAVEGLGQWTTIDVDGLKVYGISSLAYANQYGPAAFQVFNPSALGITGSNNISAHSGHKYLIAFASQLGEVEDWLISPELSGEAQTVTFWAKGMNDNLTESFEVWTGKFVANPVMMRLLTTGKTVSGWHQYTFELPAGTRYFGIRYKTAAGNALMIDDVTFEAAAQPSAVTFVGYNVYCGDQLLTAQPQLQRSFTVAQPAPGSRYTVAVSYVELESARSNAVAVDDLQGIHAVPADVPAAAPVWSLGGQPAEQLHDGQFYVTPGQTFLLR